VCFVSSIVQWYGDKDNKDLLVEFISEWTKHVYFAGHSKLTHAVFHSTTTSFVYDSYSTISGNSLRTLSSCFFFHYTKLQGTNSYFLHQLPTLEVQTVVFEINLMLVAHPFLRWWYNPTLVVQPNAGGTDAANQSSICIPNPDYFCYL